MQRTLPWGTFSSLRLQSPTESDDGPIMWVRPGEQMIPMADMPKSPFKRKRWVFILNLQSFIQEVNKNSCRGEKIMRLWPFNVQVHQWDQEPAVSAQNQRAQGDAVWGPDESPRRPHRPGLWETNYCSCRRAEGCALWRGVSTFRFFQRFKIRVFYANTESLPVASQQLHSCSDHQRRCVFPRWRFPRRGHEAAAGPPRASSLSGGTDCWNWCDLSA